MDKKKKILTLAAVVLVGGLAALSATGGIGNLKSSMIWVDNGDGTGYYANVEEDPVNTGGWDTTINNGGGDIDTNNTGAVNPLITSLTAQIKTQEDLVKNLTTKLTEAQNKVTDLEKLTPGLTSAVATAKTNWEKLNTEVQKSLKTIDLYACTNNAAYKNKGYIYAKTDTLWPVEVMQQRYLDLSGIIKTQTEKVAALKAEYAKIPNTTANKAARAAKDKEVKAAETELKRITDEKPAIQKNNSNTKCVPIGNIWMIRQKKDSIKWLEDKKNQAEADKKANADAIKTNKDIITATTPELTKANADLTDLQNQLNQAQQQQNQNGGGNKTSKVVCDDSTATCMKCDAVYVQPGTSVSCYVKDMRMGTGDFSGTYTGFVSVAVNNRIGCSSAAEGNNKQYWKVTAHGTDSWAIVEGLITTLWSAADDINNAKLIPNSEHASDVICGGSDQCSVKTGDWIDNWIKNLPNWIAPIQEAKGLVLREDGIKNYEQKCRDWCSDKYKEMNSVSDDCDGNDNGYNDKSYLRWKAQEFLNKCNNYCDSEIVKNGSVCGNTQPENGEECDDGNTIDNDGCSSTCKREYCGDKIAQWSLWEDCDDGSVNWMAGSYCDASCKRVNPN